MPIVRVRQVDVQGAPCLTEHGHVLPAVEVPVAPVGPVAVQRGVILVVVGRLRPKRVDHSDVTSAQVTKSSCKSCHFTC